MGQIKGQISYEKFINGEKLHRRDAILANCYMCNGYEQSNEDCKCYTCPIYPFSPYRASVMPDSAIKAVLSREKKSWANRQTKSQKKQ